MSLPSTTAGPPTYDRAAVARIAKRTQIRNIELVRTHFERSDDLPLPAGTAGETPAEIAIDYDWSLSEDRSTLGCVLRFAATQSHGDGPRYGIFADFRLLYDMLGEEAIDDGDVLQFVVANAVFNAWPYWREYVSSMINRAGLPRFAVPLLPHPSMAEHDDIGANEADQLAEPGGPSTTTQ